MGQKDSIERFQEGMSTPGILLPHRVSVEPNAARIHVKAMENLRQGFVQTQHDLDLAIGELRY